MPLTTACVGANVTPTVISTWFAHYIDRKPRHLKPTAHISYDEGLNVVRAFLKHAAYHTVEELQAFTAQKIPSPTWVKIQEETVPTEYLSKAADNVNAQLGERGIKRVGGKTWWQWRGHYGDLKCEWIEMKSDYRARKQTDAHCRRVMLYVHGGAYYFGSLETHRYQIQRHARKLKARVFARYLTDLLRYTSYRLSPQFPFPCGLQDCLAAYLYLLTLQDPTEIVVAGDSAGGGMVISLLVILRDQGIPLPAGAILISPWADLTHSFPSVATGSKFDYIPEHGFMHRPSRGWPPPNSEDLAFIYKTANENKSPAKKHNHDQSSNQNSETVNDRDQQTAIQGFVVKEQDTEGAKHTYPGLQSGIERVETADFGTSQADTLVVPMPNNTVVEIKDQIQMYAPNQMLSHPLVSPVLQPSLGGLPPLLILTGGGELLRDEQIYLAHKAADPAAYLPSDVFLDEHDPDRTIVNKYGPTNVQLQVWEDLCHVAPTLGWTRPAKFMYRSIAQFGAWALAHAQHKEIDIPEDDVSSISSGSSSASDNNQERNPTASIGKAGDSLPPFRKHMIRQRVDRHGMVYHLDPPDSLPGLRHPREKVGALNYDIVKKWLGAKKAWDEKFGKEKLAVQRRRIKDFEQGYFGFDGELPPACSLASRRMENDLAPPKPRKSYGMMMWSLLASKHDKAMVEKEQKDGDLQYVSADKSVESMQSEGGNDIAENNTLQNASTPLSDHERSRSRSRSRSRIVSDIGQAAENHRNGHQSSNCAIVDVEENLESNLQSRHSTPRPNNGNTPVLLIPGLDNSSSAQSSNRKIENASTMAVVDAEGVINAADGSTLNSVNASSLSSSLTPKAGAYEERTKRPEMPGREEFTTAEEFHDPQAANL
ncbi:hypothetical protein UA08_03271 [Talaromyces atroroseus]|uniref:Alpha/beta hydrolase fold-3 domain-containing protein n=1 Tax=Talaromyces atroroseus TaxID=1441469 RepID=A0A225ASW6_TALAT|nr:hypothetical protein UA08_03271 [Talaromyces atroroseus]OKL61444.1 hypothetical protein UA08_03271 [Talaromyces atroroseus]